MEAWSVFDTEEVALHGRGEALGSEIRRQLHEEVAQNEGLF